MHSLSLWERAVLILSILCQAFLLGRMWKDELIARYRYLTLFLSANFVETAIFLSLRPRSNAYAYAYFILNPILWLLSYLVVLELYRLILEDYPGISSAGRRGVTVCMALAVSIAAVLALIGSRSTGGRFPLLKLFLAVERSAILGLLVFLVLIQIFLFRYHLRLSPNRIVYSIGYASYFGLGVASDTILAELLGGRMADVVSISAAAAANLLLLAGAFILTRRGEDRPSFDPLDQTADRLRLQQQLAEMNQLLTRVARGGR